MPTRKVTTFEGTPGEASEILTRLLALGHVSPAALQEARQAIRDEVRDLEEKLARYKGLIGGVAAVTVAAAAAMPAVRMARKGAKAVASSETGRRAGRAVRKAMGNTERDEVKRLQGQYLALSRQIPKSERLKFKNMIATAGKQGAIDAMQARVRELNTKKR